MKKFEASVFEKAAPILGLGCSCHAIGIIEGARWYLPGEHNKLWKKMHGNRRGRNELWFGETDDPKNQDRRRVFLNEAALCLRAQGFSED